jgi:hypothetical protein
MNKHRPLWCLVAMLAVAACSELVPPTVDGVMLQADAGGALLTNLGADRVHYFVVDASYAARVNWAPCAEPQCAGVAGGETARVDAADVLGWGESDELLAFWWRLVPAPAGGFAADVIRAVSIRY